MSPLAKVRLKAKVLLICGHFELLLYIMYEEANMPIYIIHMLYVSA